MVAVSAGEELTIHYQLDMERAPGRTVGLLLLSFLLVSILSTAISVFLVHLMPQIYYLYIFVWLVHV